MTFLDLLVLSTYLVGVTALGMWLGRGQSDTRDYFVGNGTLPWWAILSSVIATETSSLTFLSIPGLAYVTDLTFLQIAMGYILGRAFIAFTLLPRYFQGEWVTAYALLEKRFGVRTRKFASASFMVTRAFGDSVRIFATAIPLSLLIGQLEWGPVRFTGEAQMPMAILLLGLLTLIYTYYGGMRAVVWTDFLQTLVYLFGALFTAWIIGEKVPGGWSAIVGGASDAGKLRVFDFSLGLGKPHTLLAGLIGGAFMSMSSHGVDQLMVQRLLAAKNVRESKLILISSGVAVLLQFALFLLIGVGLHAFYQGRAFGSADLVFSTFILEETPSGVTGLIIAAILAAAMSTISSALNSLSAASTHDFWLPKNPGASEAKILRQGKRFTLIWAVILLGGALAYQNQKTSAVTLALSFASLTYGGLLGVFLLARFRDLKNERSVMIGMASGMGLMSLFVVGPLTWVAWPWLVPIGCALTWAVAEAIDLWWPVRTGAQLLTGSRPHPAPTDSEGV